MSVNTPNYFILGRVARPGTGTPLMRVQDLWCFGIWILLNI